MQKPCLNGEYSVYKLRQNCSKSIDPAVDDPASQHSHDLLGPTESDSDTMLPASTSPLHGNVCHSVTERSSCGDPHQEQWQAVETLKANPLKADPLRSTDSDVLSDELSPPTRHKVVAIDTSRNKHFTRRLLPVQSPEFDNVMDQV